MKARNKKKKSERKKINLLAKFAFSIGLILFLLITYFTLLTSTGPKSFPFITKKIDTVLKEQFGNNAKLDEVLVSFTRYGSIKLSVSHLQIPYNTANEENILVIPKVEAEFPLSRLILLRLYPKNVKIIDLNFTIDNSAEQTSSSSQSNSQLPLIIEQLSAIRQKDIPIKNLEIENATLNYKTQNIETKILIKYSRIKTQIHNNKLKILTENHLNINDTSNVDIRSICNLSERDKLECDFKLENLALSSIASIHPSLVTLAGIDTMVTAGVSLGVEEKELGNITFKANATKGSVELPEILREKIYFNDFALEGEYNNKLGIANIKKISTDLVDKPLPQATKTDQNNDYKKRFSLEALKEKKEKLVKAVVNNDKEEAKINPPVIAPNPHLEVSLIISHLKSAAISKLLASKAPVPISPSIDKSSTKKAPLPAHSNSDSSAELVYQDGQKLDFQIMVQNLDIKKLDRYWPIILNDSGIREWVVLHINDGMIKNAYSKLSLVTSGSFSKLLEVDSQIAFSDLNVNYSSSFPVFEHAAGTVRIDMDSMKIDISEGQTLNTKLLSGSVAIDDFNDPNLTLKVLGKTTGQAADLLKHANYTSQSFTTEIEKYLNGNAESIFEIHLPLSGEINIKNLYLSANSTITGLKNDFVEGNVTIESMKKFGENAFISKANLTEAKITGKTLEVEKKPGIESELSLAVVIDDQNNLSFRNISLFKKEAVSETKNPTNKTITAKISGDVELGDDSMPTLISLKNQNFGPNDFSLYYKSNNKSHSKQIVLTGKRISLANLLKQKETKNEPTQKEPYSPSSLSLKIVMARVNLINNKSIRNLTLDVKCENEICYRTNISANYGKSPLIKIYNTSNPKEKFPIIEGRIYDIGYLIEGLGINDTILGGNVKFKIRNQLIDNKPIMLGKVDIDDITIFETSKLKRLAKNNLFSSIKDSIFASGKIIFNSAKLDFSMRDKIITIESLVANNLKIGITAKGVIDLNNDTSEIKGMIVPGFLINNLFGIGNIPILGKVVGVLTGGQGGGLFGIRYEYTKKKGDKEAKFETSKVSAFVPTTIRSLFE